MPEIDGATEERRRVAVRVSKDAERQLRAGHPWLYDSSIRSVSHEGAPGDLAVVFDHERAFLAIGLYDPNSPIRVRVLHAGKPRPIDTAFWRERLDAAIGLRASLISDPGTTGYRCINGENDGFGGLIVDRYEGVLVVKVYSEAWFPHLAHLLPECMERFAATAVVGRLARNIGHAPFADGATLMGPPVEAPVRFVENGLLFDADVVSGQKTGHFLDQRDNRARVRAQSAGATVLDVFSATGGFSVYAADGGAKRVHSIDVSASATAATRRHMALNSAATDHRVTTDDAFAALERDAGIYDVVIIDPPSFTSTASGVGRAVSAYGRLTACALDRLEPGGLLVQSSCTSRVDAAMLVDVVRRQATAAGRHISDIEVFGHAADHPVHFAQGSYLTTVFAHTARR